MESTEEEIERLNEQIARLQRDFDVLSDERDLQVGDLEGKLESQINDLETEWRTRCENLEKDCKEQLGAMSKELDVLRNAFSGDTNGWVTKKNKKGEEFFENVDTGEVRELMPEVLFIANAMLRVEEADKKTAELESLRVRCKEAELKRREADIAVNKIRTEVNALRDLDRGWKVASKTVYLTTKDTVLHVQSQGSILEGHFKKLDTKCKYLHNKNISIQAVTNYLKKLQEKCAAQEQQIKDLTLKNQALTSELVIKTERLDLLTNHMEEEVDRQVQPMRDEVAATMILIMKEKASRALERRHLSDLWPEGHLLPTVLMANRPLSDDEKARRIKRSAEVNAERALILEIRKNVLEATKWSQQFDDYGRAYYEHSDTLETVWEPPEIMSYEPPPGRDHLGSRVPEPLDKHWVLRTDARGEVYYFHEKTEEITYVPPNSYRKVPEGKSAEQLVGEAAQLVLTYIKGKMEDRLAKINKAAEDEAKAARAAAGLDIPSQRSDSITSLQSQEKPNIAASLLPFSFSESLTKNRLEETGVVDPEQAKKDAEAKTKAEKADLMEEIEDLKRFVYDIETVEMLAVAVPGGKEFDRRQASGMSATSSVIADSGSPKPVLDKTGSMSSKRSVDGTAIADISSIIDPDADSFKVLDMLGPALTDVEFQLMSVEQLRAVAEGHAAVEDKLERRLRIVRTNLKDFSHVLMSKVKAEQQQQAEHEKSAMLMRMMSGTIERQVGSEKAPAADAGSPLLLASSTSLLSPGKELGSPAAETTSPLSPSSANQPVAKTAENQSADTVDIASDELGGIVDNLVTLSLFCGHSGLRIDDVAYDFTKEVDLRSNSSFSNCADDGSLEQDDVWLTGSFFLAANSEMVDEIRDNLVRQVSENKENAPLVTLSSTNLIPFGFKPQQSEDLIYSARASASSLTLQQKYALWQSRQFMGEVLRFQVQQHAIHTAALEKRRQRSPRKLLSVFVSSKCSPLITLGDDESTHPIDSVELSVTEIHASGLPLQTWRPLEGRYVRLSIGVWSGRTDVVVSEDGTLSWTAADLKALLGSASVHVSEMRVEVYQTSDVSADKLICSAVTRLSKALGTNFGKLVSLELPLRDRRGMPAGSVSISVSAERLADRGSVQRAKDPASINLLERPLTQDGIFRRQNSLSESVQYMSTLPLLDAQERSFAGLVDDLRGDGASHITMMLGDVSLDDVIRLGHRPDAFSVRKLPNFATVSGYLKTKETMNSRRLKELQDELEAFGDVADELAKGAAAASSTLDQHTSSHDDLMDRIKQQNKKLKQIQDRMSKLRTPIPKPEEPDFEAFGEIPHILPVVKPSTVDSSGIKRQVIPGPELKQMIESINRGDFDGREVDFQEYGLSSSQLSQIKKAVETRNTFLDKQRVAEAAMREKTVSEFANLISDWETDERRRKAAFELSKKDSRKAHLLLSCAKERAELIASQMRVMEQDVQCWETMVKFHTESTDRFTVIRAKQLMEQQRHKEEVTRLRKSLLEANRRRRAAFVHPSLAQSEVEYQRMKEESEVELRTLRFEVLDVKHKLVLEGLRRRQFWEEQIGVMQGEVYRIKMMKDSLLLRGSINAMLEKYKSEVIYLMEDLEKVKLVEAEHDDRGLAYTVDDLGEEYRQEKIWENPVINSTSRTVELLRGKIYLTDKLLENVVCSQQHMLEAISAKFTPDFTSVRDSWCENSDYERSKQLIADMLRWTDKQKEKLAKEAHELESAKQEAELGFEAARRRLSENNDFHDEEVTCVTDSASTAMTVISTRAEDFVQKAKTRIEKLEAAVTGLSKELHHEREERQKAAIASETRTSTLMAVIATLQTTLEHTNTLLAEMTAKNTQITEKASRVAERLRYQLREERSHNANIMFIVLMQRSAMRVLQLIVKKTRKEMHTAGQLHKEEKRRLRREIWEHVFAFSKLGIDVDALFEFFTARLANLAGSRSAANNGFRRNGAAAVLGALCKSPRPLIRKHAARALAGMGWDGFVETRVLMWDCMIAWNVFKDSVVSSDNSAFETARQKFLETGLFESILEATTDLEPFKPVNSISKRALIQQRRQWALRVARRHEGPNTKNQSTINTRDGVIPALVRLCEVDGEVDWEIVRNASLALSVASYAEQNRLDMAGNEACMRLLVAMCSREDPEIKTHSAVTIANIVHHNVEAQLAFGQMRAVSELLVMCSIQIPDVLEAATAALANLTSFCDENCRRVLEENGVMMIAQLLTLSATENLLDLDQNDAIQANAAEVLTNVSRYNCELTIKQFSGAVIDALIIACTSKNAQVKRHAPLVLGNIAQNEFCRIDIGDRGGIEALFLVLEDSDDSIQANAVWALCNLMWHIPNQTRAGRFMAEIIMFMKSESITVRTHASVLLANVLCYNNSNRVNFLEADGAIEFLVELLQAKGDRVITEACLRATLSLSYLDAASLWLGPTGGCIPLFIGFFTPPYMSRDSLMYSIEIVLNMCVHHDNRRLILESGGIEALVSLLGDDDNLVRERAREILTHLEDVTPPEVLLKMRKDIGLERMVVLSSNADEIVRTVAAESIGDEVWDNRAKQSQAQMLGALDSLLTIINTEDEGVESLVAAAWALRNLILKNEPAQTSFGVRDGTAGVMKLIDRCLRGKYAERTEEVLESCLVCLLAALTNHERNSRRLLTTNVDTIIDLSENAVATTNVDERLAGHIRKAVLSDGVHAVAKNIIQLLGPYNYVVCGNCYTKQSLHGSSCLKCGYKMAIDESRSPTLKYTGKPAGTILQSNSAPSSRADKRASGRTSSQSSRVHLDSVLPLKEGRSAKYGYLSEK